VVSVKMKIIVFWGMTLFNLRDRHNILDVLPLSIFRVQDLGV
jgi:hypothetical protein